MTIPSPGANSEAPNSGWMTYGKLVSADSALASWNAGLVWRQMANVIATNIVRADGAKIIFIVVSINVRGFRAVGRGQQLHSGQWRPRESCSAAGKRGFAFESVHQRRKWPDRFE